MTRAETGNYWGFLALGHRFFTYANSSKLRNQKADVWVRGHRVTRSQDQILRAAANNRVCRHASGCCYAPTSPMS